MTAKSGHHNSTAVTWHLQHLQISKLYQGTQSWLPTGHNRDFYLVTSTEENAVSMQKITPTASGKVNLQPKIHTTTKHLLHPVYKTTHLIPPPIGQSPDSIKQTPNTPPAQQWTPFQPYFQQEDTDTESTENETTSESIQQ